MKLNKSIREKQIDLFVDNIKSQEEYEEENKKNITKYLNIFKDELEEYIFVKDINKFTSLQLGGYIRYINLNEELKWGGILLKKFKFNDINMMVLCNSYGKNFKVSFEKNIIFYKKHTTQADKTKKLFLSYLDKY